MFCNDSPTLFRCYISNWFNPDHPFIRKSHRCIDKTSIDRRRPALGNRRKHSVQNGPFARDERGWPSKQIESSVGLEVFLPVESGMRAVKIALLLVAGNGNVIRRLL